MTRRTSTYLFIVFVLAVAASAYFFYLQNKNEPPSELPVRNDETSTWLSVTAEGFSFRYPRELATPYLSLLDWPPSLTVVDEPFTCITAGGETERAGRTESIVLDGREYCRTEISEGAAGSIYTQYAYAFDEAEQTIIMTFSVRAPQCLNFDEPAQSACKEKQSSFDSDQLIQAVVATLKRD